MRPLIVFIRNLLEDYPRIWRYAVLIGCLYWATALCHSGFCAGTGAWYDIPTFIIIVSTGVRTLAGIAKLEGWD